MSPSLPRRRRVLLALIAALVSLLSASAAGHADEPPPGADARLTLAATGMPAPAIPIVGLDETAAPAGASVALARSCAEVSPGDVAPGLALLVTDADLNPESDGTRLCVFEDRRWETYRALLLGVATVEEFRRTKALYQPLLQPAGIDPCRIAEWLTSEASVQRAVTLDDRRNAGRRCVPDLRGEGARSRERLAEARESLDLAAMTAEQIFGWPPTWPLRVHLYDTHEDFLVGVRAEGGDPRATVASVEGVHALRTVLAGGITGILVDAGFFPDAASMRMLLAHEYAHVAQSALANGLRGLPFFALEGGAEFFASLVVGPEQPLLARRFQEAVDDEHHGRARPLRELVAAPEPGDRARAAAAYSRGYAAMRLLADRWGADGFVRLHRAGAADAAAFVAELTRLTGLSLDEFDRELRAWLLTRPATPVRAPGRAVLTPGGVLAGIEAYRGAGGSLDQAERFDRSATAVVAVVDFTCLREPVPLDVLAIAPGGDTFARFAGSIGPGCDGRATLELPLDAPIGGRAARETPGRWTLEVYVAGRPEGSVSFLVE